MVIYPVWQQMNNKRKKHDNNTTITNNNMQLLSEWKWNKLYEHHPDKLIAQTSWSKTKQTECAFLFTCQSLKISMYFWRSSKNSQNIGIQKSQFKKKMLNRKSVIPVVTGTLGLVGKDPTTNFLTSTAHQLRRYLSLQNVWSSFGLFFFFYKSDLWKISRSHFWT